MTGAISLRGLTKRFGGAGGVTAVDRLDLDIEAGSFYALLGPSGCGKTTTLRMIGGFEDPTEGRIQLGGEDVTHRPPFRRDVNTVFQSYALFPHMNVERNVSFGLERRRLPRDEVRRRVGEILELTQLTGLERRRPAQLSGGQQQRVALARALVNHPKALLLDEPLGALDLRLRRQLQLELKRIQREVGITFVHVTHDQEEAMTMADEIAVMCDGRIEQRGVATELYERPRTTFVASFLGTSNLIEGAVVAGGEFRTAEGERLRFSAERPPPTGAVCVGVRPEKIELLDADAPPPAADLNSLRGHVVHAGFLGTAIQYQVRTPGGAELVVTEQNRNGSRGLGPGSEVRLAWQPAHTFVVSKEKTHA